MPHDTRDGEMGAVAAPLLADGGIQCDGAGMQLAEPPADMDVEERNAEGTSFVFLTLSETAAEWREDHIDPRMWDGSGFLASKRQLGEIIQSAIDDGLVIRDALSGKLVYRGMPGSVLQ